MRITLENIVVAPPGLLVEGVCGDVDDTLAFGVLIGLEFDNGAEVVFLVSLEVVLRVTVPGVVLLILVAEVLLFSTIVVVFAVELDVPLAKSGLTVASFDCAKTR